MATTPAFSFASAFIARPANRPHSQCQLKRSTPPTRPTPHPAHPTCSANPKSLTPLLHTARETLEPLGLTISSLDWSRPVLTMLVSRDDGYATADECADASIELAAILESDDYFSETAYTLQVSSPGVSEQLASERDFTAFKGFPVRVSKKHDSPGPPVVLGRLGDVADDVIYVNIKGRMVKVARDIVESIDLCTAADIGESGPA